MKNKSIHYTDTLAVLGLLCVFAGCMVIAIMSGAKVYRRISDRDNRAYLYRTTSMYIQQKIKSADNGNNIDVMELDGGHALKITNKLGNEDFITYIYYRDGYLNEQYTTGSAQFNPNAGQKLVKIENIDFSKEDNLIKTTIRMAGGDPYDLYVFCEEEVNAG